MILTGGDAWKTLVIRCVLLVARRVQIVVRRVMLMLGFNVYLSNSSRHLSRLRVTLTRVIRSEKARTVALLLFCFSRARSEDRARVVFETSRNCRHCRLTRLGAMRQRAVQTCVSTSRWRHSEVLISQKVRGIHHCYKARKLFLEEFGNNAKEDIGVLVLEEQARPQADRLHTATTNIDAKSARALSELVTGLRRGKVERKEGADAAQTRDMTCRLKLG